ncbi:vitelline membrane outer layer protein 1-like [Heteronotia binoei]|uniref:vitelline membrane outer layer protein 1-like n=1 Tax=Heteronotia binoei TaxID=13085 RepID=UPI00292EA879|nr:vitelline membrane outer layer protein 1-like [Heteronotia binoei]
MHLIVTTVLSLLFLCCLWEVETRKVTSTLSVSNGGPWGEWGKQEFCPKGYIKGFSLKLPEKHGSLHDDTGVIAIRGYCSDGSAITSSVGKGGTWSEEIACWHSYLNAFSLRVTKPQGSFQDDTAVDNIKFKCSVGSGVEGDGQAWGKYGEWSEACKEGNICGMQTKVEKPTWPQTMDRTELNDVKFFCCK